LELSLNMMRILYKKIIPMSGVPTGTSTSDGATDAALASIRMPFAKVKKAKLKLSRRSINGNFYKNGRQK